MTKSGPSWRYRFYDLDGKERTRSGFHTKAAMLKAKHETEVELRSATFVAPEQGATVFGDLVARWLEWRRVSRPRTYVQDRDYANSYLLPHLGQMPVGKITKPVLEDWVQILSTTPRGQGRSGYAPATIEKAYQKLNMVLRYAVDRGLLAESRRPQLRDVPTSSKHEVDPLTAQQVVLLADVIDPRYRLFVMLGAQAGLRYAEIAGLHISNVQQFGSDGGLIAVTQQLRRDGTLGACKTKASERTIGVGAALIEEFVRHTEHYPASRTGLVVAAPAGGPLRYSNLRRRIWEPAMQRMVDKLGSDFRPRGTHQLRHTHAALLISQNIHPSVIKDRLGHASIKTTLDTYGHPPDDGRHACRPVGGCGDGRRPGRTVGPD